MEYANDQNRLGGAGFSGGPIQSIHRNYNNVASLKCEKGQSDRKPNYASPANDSVAPFRAKGWTRIRMMFLHPSKDPNLEIVESAMKSKGIISDLSKRFGK